MLRLWRSFLLLYMTALLPFHGHQGGPPRRAIHLWPHPTPLRLHWKVVSSSRRCVVMGHGVIRRVSTSICPCWTWTKHNKVPCPVFNGGIRSQAWNGGIRRPQLWVGGVVTWHKSAYGLHPWRALRTNLVWDCSCPPSRACLTCQAPRSNMRAACRNHSSKAHPESSTIQV